jgi:deazaflavin-dependent oxidoreductase (nitroreductase family)
MTEIDVDKLQNDPEALKTFNDDVVEEFRANSGKVGGPFEDGDIVLLTTTGAKSGQPRLSPLAFFTIDDRILIVGSFGGAPKDPAWVHNLRANAKARVEIGAESFDVVSHELSAAERDEVLPKVIAAAPVFEEYQAKTSRVIPLFELKRV